jgi:ATP-dependent DNA helicase RecG
LKKYTCRSILFVQDGFYMDETEFFDLMKALQSDGENQRIEAKKAENSLGKSVLQTICSYSNEPGLGGGYIILGLTKNYQATEPNYIVSGVADQDRMLCEIATLCRQSFNIVIRPEVGVIPHKGKNKNVILIYIPEALPHEKPIYIKSDGMEKGAFRHIGTTDQLCTREDINYLYRQSFNKKFDELLREDATFEDFDPHAIASYRQMRRGSNVDPEELKYNDIDLMRALSLWDKHKGGSYPTVAGLILFGKTASLRRLFPISTRVDYIMIEGTTWVPDPDERYRSVEFRECLVTAIPRILQHIMQDIPQLFRLDNNDLHRKDNPIIPRKVIREALCNALMHRDYTVDQPVQIRRYANRIEFANAGYSLKPEDQLGLPGSISRNNKIAAILHEIHFAETKGTGIRAMREMMQNANLTLPLIESDRSTNQFALTLLAHHLFDDKDIEWLKQFKHLSLNDEQARALIVVREMGAITNSDYRGINGVDTLTASNHLRNLRDFQLIEQKGSGSKTYYIPTSLLLTPAISAGTPVITPAISAGTPAITTFQIDIDSFSLDLRNKLQKLGQRASKEEIKSIILAICANEFVKPTEIAQLLKRDPQSLRRNYLTPMIESGELIYRFPNQIAHPHQAYRSTKTES